MVSDKFKSITIFGFILSVFPLLSIISSTSYSQEEENSISSTANSESGIVILDIPDISVDVSATGLTSVVGTVQNNSTEDVVNIKVNVTLYDSNSNPIRDTNRFVSGPFTVYESNSTERFSFLMSVEEFDNYAATAYAERAS